jgi:hypothetical protein
VQTPEAVSLQYFHCQLQSVFLCTRLHPKLKYLQSETQHMEEKKPYLLLFYDFQTGIPAQDLQNRCDRQCPIHFYGCFMIPYCSVGDELNKCAGPLRPSEIACSFVYSCVIAGQ